MKYIILATALISFGSAFANPRACPVGQHAVCMPDKVPASGHTAPVRPNPPHSSVSHQEARGGASAVFLKPYSNPAQSRVPNQAGYPFGQRMWLSFYSTPSNMVTQLAQHGMTLSGPHYTGDPGPPDLVAADKAGLKSYWRLYAHMPNWRSIVKAMETEAGRKTLRNSILRHLNIVQNDPVKNKAVVAWYAHPEESMNRPGLPQSKQVSFICFVRDLIIKHDRKKRPLFISDRGDAGYNTMHANARCTAGVMKQNYLMHSNDYDYHGQKLEERFLIGQWVREQMHAAKSSGASYTGKIKPVIATLSGYIDPEKTKYRSEAWLRKLITHDFYLSVAMGAHGVNVYSWSASGNQSKTTLNTQHKIYLDTFKLFSEATDHGKVFMWGQNKSDVKAEILSGPKNFHWGKYKADYVEPSVKLRNIQYNAERYILVVNSAKETVKVKLKGLPAGLKMHGFFSGKTLPLPADFTFSLPSLGVIFFKVMK